MDEVDEICLRKARLLFDEYYPGLVTQLEAIAGEFLPCQRPPGKRTFGNKRVIQMSLAYRTQKFGLRIDVRVTLEVTPAGQAVVQHSYHFGQNAATDSYILRVCDNPQQGHHFHLRGWEDHYDDGHIPAWRADPPLSEDPRVFLRLVEHYLATKTIQVQVKK